MNFERGFTFFFGTAFGLVALFLLLSNATAFNTILSGLGNFNSTTFRTLQGR